MKKSYILIILISFLVISPKLYAQVECPCDYFASVPMTTGCWSDTFLSQVSYGEVGIGPRCAAEVRDSGQTFRLLVISVGDGLGEAESCEVFFTTPVPFPNVGCEPSSTLVFDLTPEQVKACQCDLLAYTTALNEVAGITVLPDPPYECFDVDCRQKVLTPIPTLN